MSAGGGALAADRDQLLSCAVDFVSYDTCEKTRGTVQELVSVAKHSEGGSDQAAVDQLLGPDPQSEDIELLAEAPVLTGLSLQHLLDRT